MAKRIKRESDYAHIVGPHYQCAGDCDVLHFRVSIPHPDKGMSPTFSLMDDSPSGDLRARMLRQMNASGLHVIDCPDQWHHDEALRVWYAVKIADDGNTVQPLPDYYNRPHKPLEFTPLKVVAVYHNFDSHIADIHLSTISGRAIDRAYQHFRPLLLKLDPELSTLNLYCNNVCVDSHGRNAPGYGWNVLDVIASATEEELLRIGYTPKQAAQMGNIGAGTSPGRANLKPGERIAAGGLVRIIPHTSH